MQMRMNEEIQRTADHWVKSFQNRLLPEDDLQQESYLVFLRCQDSYDPNKYSRLNSYYSRVLYNHFVSLLRKAKVKERREELILDDPDEEDRINEFLVKNDGGAQEKLEWDELVSSISNALDKRHREIFFLLLEPTRDLIDLSVCGTGNITETSLVRYFRVSRVTIKEAKEELKEVIYAALH